MTSAIQISVVVPVRDRADLLARTLEALVAQDLPPSSFEVVVCDDGSIDDLSSVAGRFRSGPVPVRWVHQPPRGPAAARNLGIRSSSAPVVVFVDSDVIPCTSLVRLLSGALEANPAWTGAEAALVPSGEGEGPLWDAPLSAEGGHFHTAAIAYRRDVLLSVGGLDEAFPYPACEDVELAVRVLRHGPIGFVAGAVAEHPRRRVDLRTHWKWRRHWRYVTILAVRYGILGFPGHPAGPFPRLRVAAAAVAALPAGRFREGWKARSDGARDGFTAMLYAAFDVLCGIAAVPAILAGPVPPRGRYLSEAPHGAD